MIQATESDIGRRVIYDARPHVPGLAKGVIAGIEGRYVLVRFDADTVGGIEPGPIRVFSNLRWAQ